VQAYVARLRPAACGLEVALIKRTASSESPMTADQHECCCRCPRGPRPVPLFRVIDMCLASCRTARSHFATPHVHRAGSPVLWARAGGVAGPVERRLVIGLCTTAALLPTSDAVQFVGRCGLELEERHCMRPTAQGGFSPRQGSARWAHGRRSAANVPSPIILVATIYDIAGPTLTCTVDSAVVPTIDAKKTYRTERCFAEWRDRGMGEGTRTCHRL
jgi:hypothetical protein